jgi:hypothetical protein
MALAKDNKEVKYLVMFDSPIDNTRCPILEIGKKSIPLY